MPRVDPPPPFDQVLLDQANSNGAAFTADAYSFGVVTWEIFSGQLPWAGKLPMHIAILVTQEKRQLDIPPHCPPEIKTLMATCFEHDPKLRPRMEEVEADFPEEHEATPVYSVGKKEPSAFTLSGQITLPQVQCDLQNAM